MRIVVTLPLVGKRRVGQCLHRLRCDRSVILIILRQCLECQLQGRDSFSLFQEDSGFIRQIF